MLTYQYGTLQCILIRIVKTPKPGLWKVETHITSSPVVASTNLCIMPQLLYYIDNADICSLINVLCHRRKVAGSLPYAVPASDTIGWQDT